MMRHRGRIVARARTTRRGGCRAGVADVREVGCPPRRIHASGVVVALVLHGEHVGVDSNAAAHDATPTASAKRRRRARGPPPPDPLAFAGAIAPLTMQIQNVATSRRSPDDEFKSRVARSISRVVARARSVSLLLPRRTRACA